MIDNDLLTARVSTPADLPQMPAQARWFGRDTSVEIGGIRIDHPHFYVGPRESHLLSEAFIIDPACEVAARDPDFSGQGLGFWPSYARMSPRARRAYLLWNAEGRQQADVHPAFVLLFFFGLEVRLLIDPSVSDAASVWAEVDRLAHTHRNHTSFRKVVCNLMDAFELAHVGKISRPNFAAPLGAHSPLAVKLTIGQIVKNHEPVPADALLHWAYATPARSFELPAAHRLREFSGFFAEFLSRIRPNGLLVRDTGALPLKYTYRAASGAFSFCLDDKLKQVPDIDTVPQVRLEFEMLLRSACETFARRYRRSSWIANAPEQTPTASPPFQSAPTITEPQTFGRESVQALALAHARNGDVMSMRAALKRFRGQTPNQLLPSEIVRLADVLASAGLGLVPDPRYDLRDPRVGDEVLVFELGELRELAEPSAAFRNALLALMVSITLARSDGDLSSSEFELVTQIVDSFPGLSEVERARLKTEQLWLQRFPMPLAPIYKAASSLDADQRADLARTIIAIIQADAKTTHEEITFARSLYRRLGLTDTQLKIDLGLQDPGRALFEQTAKPIVPSVPPSELPTFDMPDGEEADDDLLALLRELSEGDEPIDALPVVETAEISELFDTAGSIEPLVEIDFAETEDLSSPHLAQLDGLDDRHKALLVHIMRATEVNRRELERIAREQRLMGFGAIEHINDCVAATHGEPIFEIGEDEVVRVNKDCQLITLKGAA
jgi:uncharacterized tellurite resistance protein B-like protein